MWSTAAERRSRALFALHGMEFRRWLVKYKSCQDLLFASSFRGPVPRGRAGKEYHSTPYRRSRAQPGYLHANKCCATHPASTCAIQSGQITPVFLCHRNLVKFRDIEYILNFQLGRGPNPRMVHPALSLDKHKEKDICHINYTSDFQAVPQPHSLRRITSLPDLAF